MKNTRSFSPRFQCVVAE